jgi:hypothetical protein
MIRSIKFNIPHSDLSYWSEGSCSLTIQSHWLEGAQCPIGRQGSVVPQSDLFPVGILVHRVLQYKQKLLKDLIWSISFNF